MKATIFVLADIESHEGLGRVVNTLEAVKQLPKRSLLLVSGHTTKHIACLLVPVL